MMYIYLENIRSFYELRYFFNKNIWMVYFKGIEEMFEQ